MTEWREGRLQRAGGRGVSVYRGEGGGGGGVGGGGGGGVGAGEVRRGSTRVARRVRNGRRGVGNGRGVWRGGGGGGRRNPAGGDAGVAPGEVTCACGTGAPSRSGRCSGCGCG